MRDPGSVFGYDSFGGFSLRWGFTRICYDTSMIRQIIIFFDKLEDATRIALSHHPIPYAFIGGVGIVLFWKGVWEVADLFPILFGLTSVIVGVVILLLTGLLVSFFIGDSIILSGFNREKKLVEKTESEVRSEKDIMETMVAKLDAMEANPKRIEEKLNQKEP